MATERSASRNTLLAVHRRAEQHAFLGHLAQSGEAENLKPPESVTIGRRQPMKRLQPAAAPDDVDPRAQHQMKSVGQDDVGAGGLEHRRRHRLDRGRGADPA